MHKITWDKASHLVEIDTNPIPGQADVGMLQARDGKYLRNAVFWPEAEARATIVLMTGYSEFIEKYFETIGDLLAAGYCVVLPEWRCHGLSDGNSTELTRLHLINFDQNIDDLEDRLPRLLADCPTPVFGLAHSMGGQISLRAAHRHGDWFAALAQSAPMHGVALPPISGGIVKLLAMAYRTFGRGDSWNPLVKPAVRPGDAASNNVTNDQQRYQRGEALYVSEPRLQVNGQSLSWILTALQAMKQTRKPDYLRSIETPLFIGTAEDELLVDNRAHADVLAHVPHGEGAFYAGAMHELMMEVDAVRDTFLADVFAFFQKVTPH